MSERGVFAVDRGIWAHPLFADEPFTEREAWLWLVSEASFKERRRNVAGAVVHLRRGQLCASVRFMAEAWGWSKSRVDRFLKRLKTETMIGTTTGTEAGTGPLIITICNYDNYQRVSLPNGTSSGTQEGTETGTLAGQQRDKLEDIENTKIESGAVAERRPPARPLRFEEFWVEYPRRKGANPKKTAEEIYRQKIKSGIDAQTIIDAAKRYREDVRRCGQEGSQYVAQARTWLREQRWIDYPPLATEQISLVPGTPPPTDWRHWMRGYTAFPPHARSWRGPGNRPGEPGCEVPEDILLEFGFATAPPTSSNQHSQPAE